jgi:hypothetical protein
LVERLLSGVNLLVDELPADVLLASQLRDRFRSGEDLDGKGLPLRREELLGRPTDVVDGTEVRLRETDERRSLAVHARFLLVGRGIDSPPPTLEETGILGNPISVDDLVPGFEPGRIAA